MKKRLLVTFAAAVVAVSLMGCNVTTTTTKTYTETDADGNTTTTTTTTTNGETTTETTQSGPATDEVEKTVATIAFENVTDFDFAALYFSSGASDNWGEDILGDDAPLAVGEVITFPEMFTYSADNTVWDIKAEDAEGNNVEFNGADMAAAADPTNITIVFTYDADSQSYTASIE